MTGPGLPSPSLSLPGNSSLGLGLSPSPAPPRLRLRSVWNRIFPPHPGRETASCRSCRLEPRVSRLHISLCGVGEGSRVCAGGAGASVGVGECTGAGHCCGPDGGQAEPSLGAGVLSPGLRDDWGPPKGEPLPGSSRPAAEWSLTQT